MKKSTKVIIAICGLIVGLIVVLSVVVFSRVFDIGASEKQMDDAKEYMDSLTDKDIQTWIQRTKMYLAHPPTNFDVDTGPFPSDLKKLGITGIEEGPGYVGYIWFGGMDDTGLWIEQMSNGDFQVTADYTPYTNRVIWPRQ